jgi:hypothetical protein
MDVILVHGYNVTSTKTYGVLPQRLKSLGHNVKDVYLSKYVTLDDDLTLPDIVKAFHVGLQDLYGAQFEKKKFACVTHSTGGLVARAWVDTFYSHRTKSLPASHLIMLAPPNHGSRLATLGKSRLSRVRSLWGVEPGLQVLDALELGSDYQRQLNAAWISKKLHTIPGFFPVVVTGQWIDKKLWDTIIPATYERGSDGVVRAAAANLNMQKFSIDVDGKVFQETLGGVPFLITPQTAHADETYGIMAGIPAKGEHAVLDAIEQVLDVETRKEYQALEADWAMKTTLLQRQDKYFDGTPLDRYSQVVIRVMDSMGTPLADHAIELLNIDSRGDLFPSGFMAHSYQNDKNPENFVYYFDYTQLSKVVGKQVGLRIQSVTHSPLVSYDDARFKGVLTEVGTFIIPNQTTYVEVTMRRRLNKNVFRLTDDFSYQKIKGTPSDDWIK